MALKVGELFATITLDPSAFESSIRSMEEAFLNLAARAISINTLFNTLKFGIQYNASIEQLQMSFEVMTGSAEKAAAMVETLQTIAAETPFEVKGLAETVQVLMSYGMGGEAAIEMLTVLGDVAQGSQEKLYGIALAYGQMTAKGKVQQQEINQMINQGFSPLQAIVETTGTSMDELTFLMGEGMLSVDMVTKAMIASTQEGGKYFQSMGKQAQTLNGKMSTLRDETSMLVGEMTKPVNEGLKSALPLVTEMVAANREIFQTGGWDLWLRTVKEGVGLMAKEAPEGWKNLLFGASELPAGSYAITLADIPIEGEHALTEEAQRIVEEFYTNLQDGMSKEQALEFMFTWTGTGTGADLQAVLNALYEQFFPETPEEVEIPVTPAFVPESSGTTTGAIEPSVFSGILESLTPPVAELAALGQDMSAGVGEGMAGYSFTSDGAAVSGNALDAVASAAGQGSPCTAFMPLGSDMSAGIAEGMKSFDFSSTGSEITASITSAMSTATATIRTSGLNFSRGLAAGIKAGKSTVINAAKEVAKAAIAAANKALKVGSPSRVMAKSGQWFDEGFAIGIMDSIRVVTGAASEMARMAADAATVRNPGASVRTTYAAAAAGAGYPSIDYDRLGRVVADTLIAHPPVIDLDGQRVSRTISRIQNSNSRAGALGRGK